MAASALDLNYQPQVFADTKGMSRKEWLQTRRYGIGGSESSIVMGVSPFSTKRDLYYDKLGIQPLQSQEEEDNWIAKEVGNRLEDLVAIIFSKKTGFSVYPDKHMYQHPFFPFMKADVDFVILFPDGTKGLLECKTCNYNSRFKWEDNQVPINYEWQCRHYMAVMNLDVCYIACLYGNNDSQFVIRKIVRDLEKERELIQEEQVFWENHVLAKVLPPYEEAPDLVLESIRRHTKAPDKALPPVTIRQTVKAQLDRYLKLAEEKSLLDARKREIEKEQKTLSIPFIEELGEACQAFYIQGNERYQISYNPTTRKSVNKDNITKLENLYPDVYEDVITESTSRTFRIKKEAV